MRHAPLVFLFSSLTLTPSAVAQHGAGDGDWRFYVRAGVSGQSHESQPVGYKIYSGVGFEIAIALRLSEVFSVELSVRAESREVDGPAATGSSVSLGSIETLPINLTFLYRPLGRKGTGIQPYLGAGLNSTVVWEKSGALDSTDSPATINPVIQLGASTALSPTVAFNVDLKWNSLTTDIEGLPDPAPSVSVDPLTLAVGLGFAL